MAQLHGLSRQTLLYYDKIGLFEPIHVAENGYRYYSPKQIPFLREICFLRSLGVKLEEIREHVHQRDLSSIISLLERHKSYVEKEIEDLIRIKQHIQEKHSTYSEVEKAIHDINRPDIKYFPARTVLFFPIEATISKQELHFGVMKGWEVLGNYNMLPVKDWGTIIPHKNLHTDNLFSGAGVFVRFPLKCSSEEKGIQLPEGEYACMYKYGMPYDYEHLYRLVDWIEQNGYRIAGDIVDCCLLDTTFYQNEHDVDFCQLQIPIMKVV